MHVNEVFSCLCVQFLDTPDREVLVHDSQINIAYYVIFGVVYGGLFFLTVSKLFIFSENVFSSIFIIDCNIVHNRSQSSCKT